MPGLADCTCVATLVSAGLVEGQSWPSCAHQHDITSSIVEPGRCQHEPDCMDPATKCRFVFETTFDHNCVGMIFVVDERAIGATEWTDLGLEILVQTGLGAITVKPACGFERRLRVLYSGEAIWESVMRCGKCPAMDQS